MDYYDWLDFFGFKDNNTNYMSWKAFMTETDDELDLVETEGEHVNEY
jgi:hypothetical protein